MNSIEYYIEQHQNSRPHNLPDFILDVKDLAMEALKGTSLPSAKDEKYLYTRVADFFNHPLKTYHPSGKDFAPKIITRLLNSDIPDLDSYSIILNNGYHLHNEPIHELPGGIVLGSFMNVIRKYKHIYQQFFTNYKVSDDTLVNLNTMMSEDGFFLYVPAKSRPEKTIQITNLLNEAPETLIQPRNLIVMEPGSSADVVICDYTLSDHTFVCNDVTEILAGKGSSLNMLRLQQVNSSSRLITHTSVIQHASSHVKTHYISLAGQSIRNNLTVGLNGKNAGHKAQGLSLTRENEHTDNQVQITHAVPNCHSDQLFKHILYDTSTSAFTGRILVAADAQKTLAYQRSSNILLNPKSKMNIRPQLEIYADDVKCSHGATIGQLDNEALFYLRSRGIGQQEAVKILLKAFAEDILKDISDETLKNKVAGMVENKMQISG